MAWARKIALSFLLVTVHHAALADSKAINDLTKKGGILDTADQKGKSYVDRLTDPNNMEDPNAIAQERAKDFAKAAAAAAKAATNVPGTSLKGTRPGIFSTIWFAIKSFFGVASGTSGTTPTNKPTGYNHGIDIADAAVVAYQGNPITIGDAINVPYQFTSFHDAFGGTTAMLYDFALSVTSDLTDIAGGPFLADGSGMVTSAPLLDLTPEFGSAIPQYQLISVSDVPLAPRGTYTVHVQGWAAVDIPEPSGLMLALSGLGMLAVARARRPVKRMEGSGSRSCNRFS
ncbi:MAG: PEP-CTERM sorting domain-containing protein [Rhodospirillales bacterium]|nr:PEP-CTERM sorting domain-containing protein [Rhodospirillales bacterium]